MNDTCEASIYPLMRAGARDNPLVRAMLITSTGRCHMGRSAPESAGH